MDKVKRKPRMKFFWSDYKMPKNGGRHVHVGDFSVYVLNDASSEYTPSPEKNWWYVQVYGDHVEPLTIGGLTTAGKFKTRRAAELHVERWLRLIVPIAYKMVSFQVLKGVNQGNYGGPDLIPFKVA